MGSFCVRCPIVSGKAARVNHIKINWSVYPSYVNYKSEIVQYAESKGVVMSTKMVEKFRHILNLRGDSDPEEAFRFCRRLYFAPFLRDGNIYLCSRPVAINTYNNKFKTSIPVGDYCNIHSPVITGWEVLLSISQSSGICKYCATKLHEFQWTETSYCADEWDVEGS